MNEFNTTCASLSPLPRNGEKCLGFSRSTIYKLITPSPANDYRPPVRSISAKTHAHNKRGKRLVCLKSLAEYIASQACGWDNTPSDSA